MNMNIIWSTLVESVEPLSDLALDKALAELNLEPGDMTWVIRVFHGRCGKFGLKQEASLDKFSSLTHIKSGWRARAAGSAPLHAVQERR